MNYETNRLNTFTDWPSSAPVDPIRIAKAGFFYTGEGTEVKCFCCGSKISQWNYGDQVMWRHRQLQPNCPFVVHPEFSGNVPLVLGPDCPPSIYTRRPSVPPDDVQNDHTYTAPDYGLTEEDETYKNDALRLLSFINWDDTSVSRQALVNAGFYHAGEGRLRCAWCGGELAPYNHFSSVSPLEVHRMYFSRCQHAAGLEAAQQAQAGNISTSSSPSLSPSPPNDTPRAQSPPTNPNNLPQSSGAAHNERVLSQGGTWRTLGVVGGGARHPQYASLAARLASFDRWPADRHQAPRALAEAGFFHTGTDDQVRCFYCDGGLGKWEAGDTPWSEHAHWFPHCGYVLLVKGQEYVDNCKNRTSVQRTVSFSEGGRNARRRNGDNFPITESQVEECMESTMAAAALGAGLDAARVRRAIANRLRSVGTPFTSSEALIDAVLDDQLNEEPWSMTPQSRLARDILSETFREFAPRAGIPPQQVAALTRPYGSDQGSMTPDDDENDEDGDDEDDAYTIDVTARRQSPTTETESRTTDNTVQAEVKSEDKQDTPEPEGKKLSLEEENRQLKEARLCKVCMDCEVSVVFLPCGHLVSCARCGAALGACPLCRASVRALVRAYLA
ncbi:baculoviral IAP repeat-containing protein 3 [Helicoverpa armigera]|uniref:baculoviral IAP repeat-containing protein 3 n=1 Tax=Helicoverpa armigera TaxID=29058 RepID=UPI002112B3DD|nr:baculoviral IAP repeat-containing protein 3 [Helicoverpa armigera]